MLDLHVISSVLLLFPASVIIYKLPGWSVLYTWHPFFMSLAFFGTMINLIYILRKDPKWKFSAPSMQNGRDFHIYGMLLTLLFVLLGFSAIFVNKMNAGKSHFTSRHGTFGLITFILVILQSVLGLPLGFKQYLPDLKNLSEKLDFKKISNVLAVRKIHAIFGTLTSMLALTTLITAFQTAWFEKNVQSIWGGFRNLFIAITVHGYLLVVYQVYTRYGKVQKRKERLNKSESKEGQPLVSHSSTLN